MKTGWVKYALGILYAGFIIAIIYAANHNALFQGLLDWVRATPGMDKVGHFVLVGTLAFLVNWMLNCRTMPIAGRPFYLGSAGCFALFTMEEISQIWIPTRTFDFFDFLCNTLGILIIGSLAKFLPRTNVPAEPAS